MILTLCDLPPLKGPDEWGNRNPEWAGFLYPDAAKSLVALEKATGGIDYTDIFRPPEVSLRARAEKRGVQPPGFSAHNYGLAVDVTVEEILKTKGWTYGKLLEVTAEHGWFCHRRDGKRGIEDWHFNHLGPNGGKYLPLAKNGWAAPVEALMQDLYGEQMKLTPAEVQAALKKLRMYSGAVDGKIGPMSKAAITAFQKAWGLTPDGDAGPRTQRVLALVTAERKLVPIPA